MNGVGDALLAGAVVASGGTRKTSGVDEGLGDGRGLRLGEETAADWATGKVAGEAATGWTRSNFFQVFQK